MDYLFQDGGKPKAKKSKTASKTTKSKTNTKTTKSKSSSKTGTKTTKSKTTSKKSSSKKGGNFLGAVGDLVAPTGWGPFATAAGLLALDRVDSALRRGKSEKSSAKKGGMRGGKASEQELNELIPAIDIYKRNLPDVKFMRFQAGLPADWEYPEFFTVYENYFKERNSNMSELEHAKLQKQRYRIIKGILDTVKLYANYREPAQSQIYFGNKAGDYFTLASNILKDIETDYKAKNYDSTNTNTVKLNRTKL
jgi:hypothetical protein